MSGSKTTTLMMMLLLPGILRIMTASAWAQGDRSTKLIEARRLEMISHQPEKALAIYADLLANKPANDNDESAGTAREDALVGRVRCLLKLGRIEEARAAAANATGRLLSPALATSLTTLFSLYGQQTGGHAQASLPLDARVESLVRALGAEGNTTVASTLRGLGKIAVPHLLAAARLTTDLKVQGQALRILAARAVDDPQGEAGQVFAHLDQEPDLVLVDSALQALVGELSRRSSHDRGKEWNLYRPAMVFCAMADRLAGKEIPLIESRLIDLMGSRDDDPARTYLRARLQVEDREIRRRAVRAGMRAGGAFALEVARTALGDPDERIRRDVVKTARDQGRADILFEACRSPDLETRTLAWSEGDEQLATLEKSRLGELTKPFVADLIASHGDRHLLETYDRFRIPPLEPRDLGRVLREGGFSERDLQVVLDWLIDMIPRPEALSVLEDLASEPRLATLLPERLEMKDPLEARNRILVRVVESLGVTSETGRRSLEMLAIRPDSGTVAFARQVAQSGSWNFGDYPNRTHSLLIRILFHEPGPDSGADLDQVVARSGPMWAKLTIETLPEGKVLLEHPDLIEALQKIAAGEAQVRVRIAACKALLSTGSHELCLETLINTRLESGAPLIQPESIAAAFAPGPTLFDDVRRFIDKASPGILETFGVEAVVAARRYVENHPEARPRLVGLALHALESGRPPLRWQANGALCTSYPEGDMPAAILRRVIHDDQETTETLEYIARNQRADLREEVESLLDDPDLELRLVAIKALSALLDPRSAKPLLGALADANERVRQAAREALASIHNYLEEKARWEAFEGQGETILSPLAALLRQTRDSDTEIRLTAVRALGALGDSAALPHLIEMLRSDETAIREAARESIERLMK